MKLLVAGGGTGGHLYPGIAVVQELLGRFPQSQVLFVGSRKELDSELIQNEGFAFQTVSQKPFPTRRYFKSYFQFCISFWVSLFQALKICRAFKPRVLLGMGGFSSVPTVIAARLLGIHSVLFEPNIYPGKANRFLAFFASKIAVGFKADTPFFKNKKVVCTGIPVRQEIAALKNRQADFGHGLQLLVMGGSRGARAINQTLIEAFPQLKQAIPGLTLVHITGKELYAEVQAGYGRLLEQGDIQLYPYVREMDTLFKKAQLVIARSGASSLAEFSACGLPAILVPYPYSAQDHQIWNAQFFQKKGAAKMILEKDFSPEALVQTVASFTSKRLEKMRQSALQLSKEGSAAKIVDLLTELKK